MEKIWIIESAMEFRGDESKGLDQKSWETMYADKTLEQAEKDVRHHRRGEYLRRKNEIEPIYKCYYRAREVYLY